MREIDALPRLPGRIAVAGAVAALAAATTLANRVLPGWAYPVCGAATAGVLIGLGRLAGLGWAEMGLSARHGGRSARTGGIACLVVVAGFAVALAVPALRTLFHDGRVGRPPVGEVVWLALVRIPLGTVLVEEVAFRGVLPALLGGGDRWRWRPVLGASALFGLWHLLPSLALRRNAAVDAAAGQIPLPVLSVLAMAGAAAAGVALCALRYGGRGILAPALVHLALNSGGLVLAWAVQRGS
ncbi:CPBP family intramembrane glutamic endopeptidase [Amycolatopsis thermophila]|uniref:Membrane protease YdiL (CAAX protease family) n=1 Tax=Amycolatopsis thermophila TaxID=206084 RepID=A0ABU0F221_9PSEU|nr:CPBP family intramembrane glutamic endopeptidase [Amycolatopsis thermophila]MDQ0381629.1 membrane protease YdiL (CAAX protease family) [Amycolatopsis thermophila]